MARASNRTKANRALGEAIRAIRLDRGFTQEGFAAHAGIDRSYQGVVERGECNFTIATLFKIAAALGVPASTLLRRANL